MQSALHATLSDVQWVVESYALFLAALLLVGGVLGDLYGRRKMFAIEVALFSAASILCGCAPTIRWLVVARGVQGIGGALLIPGSLALISANFSEEERGRAIGTWSGFTSITAGRRSRDGRMVHPAIGKNKEALKIMAKYYAINDPVRAEIILKLLAYANDQR